MVTIKDRDQLVINGVVSQKATEIKGFPFIQVLENTTEHREERQRYYH